MHSRRDMIRTGLGAAIFAALPRPARDAAMAHRSTEPDLKYFHAALGAARWLRATAIVTPTGTSWPAVPPDAKTVEHSLYTGFPGVVLFFIELARATGDRTWLDLAASGADQLAAALPDEKAGDESTGLYTGLAGIAYTLEETDRARGECDTRPRSGALGAIVAAHMMRVRASSGTTRRTSSAEAPARVSTCCVRRRRWAMRRPARPPFAPGAGLSSANSGMATRRSGWRRRASRATCRTSPTARRVWRISWQRSQLKRETRPSRMPPCAAADICNPSRRQPMATAAGSFTTIRMGASCST